MTTKRACVIGWPVKHSRAPIIHGHWIEKHRLDCELRLEEVSPEAFPQFLATLAERGYVGGTATMPHKEVALALTEPDERAKAIGACNAMWFENGRLRSTNTDVVGFLDGLDAAAPGWDRRTDNAVVFGAGGTARAVLYGLVQRGVPRIHVFNRTLAKAQALRDRFGLSVAPTPWEALAETLEGAALVANAASFGMAGYPELDVDLARVRSEAVVADVVYVPLETSLIRQARARGLRYSDGLAMLLYQASGCFDKWFGVHPVVTPELRERVENALRIG